MDSREKAAMMNYIEVDIQSRFDELFDNLQNAFHDSGEDDMVALDSSEVKGGDIDNLLDALDEVFKSDEDFKHVDYLMSCYNTLKKAQGLVDRNEDSFQGVWDYVVSADNSLADFVTANGGNYEAAYPNE